VNAGLLSIAVIKVAIACFGQNLSDNREPFAVRAKHRAERVDPLFLSALAEDDSLPQFFLCDAE